MQRPKLILFDLMGTLLLYAEDSRPYWHRIAELVDSEGIMPAATFNARYAAWRDHRGPGATREVTLRKRLTKVAPALSVKNSALDDIVDTYMSE